MSETFVTFILLGIIVLVQFLVIDGHLDCIEKKIDELKETENKDA